MSSASSGRYQSRLFNFIHQQSRRVTEQCKRAFRHVQVATSWVAPVVLYPLYLLFQSDRMSWKVLIGGNLRSDFPQSGKLHQSVQTSWQSLEADDTALQTPLAADTPIQRVLLLVDTLPSLQEGQVSTEEVIVEDRPVFPAFLASLRFQFFQNSDTSISSRTQPTLIHNRPIIRGIATQLSNRSLVLTTAQNEILDVLTPQQQQKFLERIIEEVANYWRHQRLAHASPARLGMNTQVLAFLDRTFANLESNSLATISKIAVALSKRSRLQQVKTQLKQPYSSESIATPGYAENNTFKIQALIRAAIDYFFGNRSGKPAIATTPTSNWELAADSKPSRKPLSHQHMAEEFSPQLPPQLDSSDKDPWLTLGDLFGAPELEGESTQQTPLPQYSLQNLLTSFQKFLLQLKRTSGQVLPPTSQPQFISSGESHQPHSQSSQLKPAPDWIETTATAMGYVKHPLERLLEWLDIAMLWLEELLARVWQWVRQVGRGKEV